MKVAVRYYTKSGNTQKLADAIAAAVQTEAKDVSVSLEEYTDVLFLGSSVYAAGVADEVKEFIANNRTKIGKIYNFSTAALIESTYKQMKKIAAEQGVTIAEKEFHCRGSFGIMHRNRPNAEDLKKAVSFAKSVINKN